jgi:hypothetical protein
VNGVVAITLVAEFGAVEQEAYAKLCAELWGHGGIAVGGSAESMVGIVVNAADFVGGNDWLGDCRKRGFLLEKREVDSTGQIYRFPSFAKFPPQPLPLPQSQQPTPQ